jgi:hypothetical protein
VLARVLPVGVEHGTHTQLDGDVVAAYGSVDGFVRVVDAPLLEARLPTISFDNDATAQHIPPSVHSLNSRGLGSGCSEPLS